MPFATLALCVMPEHLHVVWRLPPKDPDFSRRWALLKASFSSALAMQPSVSTSQRARREKGIWQRRFWEHQIRDDVAQARDWPHSSFHRYVERGWLTLDWGMAAETPSDGYGE